MNFPSRRAKIVATLGPATSTAESIEELLKAGVNVVRMNFSHGTHDQHRVRFELVRAAAKKLGKPVAILQDLQGPKLRVGKFPSGTLTIDSGEQVILRLETSKSLAEPKLKVIPFNYERLAQEVAVGHRILIDDGNLEIKVTAITDGDIHAKVIYGGLVKDHKGMNFPDTRVTIEAFTPKDREDLEFGLQIGIDFCALSFVRSVDDIASVRKFMADRKKDIPIVSKIEKGEAIENLDSIIAASDAVMVARGDLAVEVGTALVPHLQKRIIRQCNLRGIPVITATQMLESMINTPRPTRAEASDVANAVIDGTDALMLSAESASGKFPTLAVSVMHSIILETEQQADELRPSTWLDTGGQKGDRLQEAVEHAAGQLAAWIDAKAIACTTHTGRAARALAKYRPRVPIIAFTDVAAVRRQLALVWGVETVQIEPNTDIDKLFVFAEVEIARMRLAGKGDRIVLTAGWPPLQSGSTNLMKVVTVRSDYTH